jgi:hypothetical protein
MWRYINQSLNGIQLTRIERQDRIKERDKYYALFPDVEQE